MPTATDRDFLDMPVSDVRRIARSGRDHHVVVLHEVGGDRRLPIWIGREAAIEIALRLLDHGWQLARPLGSDLTARLVQALGGSLREIRIDRLTEGTFYAVIVVDGPQGIAEVDARPSDALALALVVGAPVRADREVVDTVEASDDAAEALAAIDSQEAAGPQALLDELAEEAQRQDPPRATSS
jgi:bifunctional DNase/RNase